MQMASSASCVCRASRSASEYTATVSMPISRQARMIRTADLSPVGDQNFLYHTLLFLSDHEGKLCFGHDPSVYGGGGFAHAYGALALNDLCLQSQLVAGTDFIFETALVDAGRKRRSCPCSPPGRGWLPLPPGPGPR